MSTGKPSLQVRAVWVPRGDGPDIAYVSERRRQNMSLLCFPVAIALTVAAVLAELPLVATLLLPSAVLFAGTIVTLTGRSGYYTLDRDVRPDRYLGRRAPELSSYRRVRRRRATARRHDDRDANVPHGRSVVAGGR